ncbi:SWIM-type domain-containing protein [Trichonephila clavipes]|nr:SWIM-type domain-containing protein [Trichonephila clavipes]
MNDDFFIQGFVKAEMKKKVTYKPSVQIKTTCQVISATCTCPAGGTPAFCKHVFALLHTINDYIAKKLYEAPTERLQTWHQPKPVKMVPQTSEVFMREPAIVAENEIEFDFTAAPFFYLSLDGSVQKYAGNQTQGNYSSSSVFPKTGLVVHPIEQYIAASPDGLIRSVSETQRPIGELSWPYGLWKLSHLDKTTVLLLALKSPHYRNYQSQSSFSETREMSKEHRTSYSHNMPRIAAIPLVRQSDLPRLSLVEGVASHF